MDFNITHNPEPDRRPAIAVAVGVIIIGLVMAIWVFAPSDGAPAGAGTDQGPGCVEQREEPQYAKWVRERETTESEWGDWYLYDNGSVTNWTGGSGYLSPLMQYEYRPNGETRTVDVPVDCPTTTEVTTSTTSAPTSTSVSSTTSPSTSVATSTTAATASSTAPSTTTSSSPSSTPPSTSSTQPSSEPSSTPVCPQGTHQSGQGCLPNEAPPTVIVVCRDGAVVEIHPGDRQGTDSDNLTWCGRKLPATK